MELVAHGHGDTAQWETRAAQGEWPGEPFRDAAPGDWCALGPVEGSDFDRDFLMWEVEAVEETSVRVRLEWLPAVGSRTEHRRVIRTLPRREPCTVSQLLFAEPLGRNEGISSRPDRQAAAGQELAATRLEFRHTGDPMQDGVSEYVVWISPGITSPGVMRVEQKIRVRSGGKLVELPIAKTLLGHGRKGQVACGKRPTTAR